MSMIQKSQGYRFAALQALQNNQTQMARFNVRMMLSSLGYTNPSPSSINRMVALLSKN